jgi:hypothetical protein
VHFHQCRPNCPSSCHQMQMRLMHSTRQCLAFTMVSPSTSVSTVTEASTTKHSKTTAAFAPLSGLSRRPPSHVLVQEVGAMQPKMERPLAGRPQVQAQVCRKPCTCILRLRNIVCSSDFCERAHK